MASEASLIATFYGPRPAEPPHPAEPTLSLYRQLDDWEYPIAKKFLLPLIDPPGRAASDTTVIQLGLNAPGNAAVAWERMRGELENILDARNLQDTWGYTLVYQAVLTKGTDADEVLDELLSAVRRLHPSEDPRPLVQACMSGGEVWLLAIPPTQGDGLAATVYVALSPPEQEEALLDVFYGPGASLLMPDLLAHKVYYHARLYSNGLQNKYEEGLREFRKSTNQLLNDLGEQPVEKVRLKELARKSNGLAIIASGLNELQVLMTRQLHNYDEWRTEFKGNSIVEYHRERLKTANLELELLIAQGRDALEWSKAAISQAQVQTDRAQERRQLRIEALLAAAGVALALPHLLEPETISAFLEWPIGHEVLYTENGLLTGIGHLIVLVVQVAIILPVAVLTYFGVKGSLHKPRGASKR